MSDFDYANFAADPPRHSADDAREAATREVRAAIAALLSPAS